MRIFYRLKHGLGDNGQFRICVAHIRQRYPDAYIKIECRPGCECFFTDLADDVGPVTYPYAPWGYDIAEYVQFVKAETLVDGPNTKAAYWLRSHGYELDPDLFRYDVVCDNEIIDECKRYT